jgi:1-deoxyxylulose-5-phosphate synthase
MEYVNLGMTGVKVSRLALGCMTFGSPQWQPWVLDEAASTPIIERALDLGINFFDTADAYSRGESEVVVGRLLKRLRARHRLVLASKLYYPISDDPNDRGLSRKHIFEAVDASLKRLGTDYMDLYQIHRFDHSTPLEETLDALNDVVRAGKVLYLGASSMHAWQFMKALGVQRRNGWAQFVSMQPHYNLIYREEEREMLPLCTDQGIGVIPWSPMARGKLARPWGEVTERTEGDEYGKTLYVATEEANRQINAAVAEVASTRGVKMAQVALAWVLQKQPVTAPIVGATKLAHVADAVGALELELSQEEIEKLEAPYRPTGIAGFR